MKFKLILAALLLAFLVAISASAVSAADNNSSDIASSEIEETDIDLTNDILTANPKTFTDLNNAINGNKDKEITLTDDYMYNPDTDSRFIGGISFNHVVTIKGNGHTIDGANTARIFMVSNTAGSGSTFKNITFVNGKGTIYPGAITGYCNAVDCTFIGNSATGKDACGGAMIYGRAVNCTFNGNYVTGEEGVYGGAMYGGSATGCTFIGNYAKGKEACGGAILGCDATNCTFIGNRAIGEDDGYGENSAGGAMYNSDAKYCTFINNTAADGGACIGYQHSVMYCTFIGNTADENGAVGFGDPDISVAVNCTFINNHAVYDVGAMSGKAINCTFINNSARDIGAKSYGDTINCTFIGNTATGDAGAMYGGFFEGKYWYKAENCLFANNTAKNGGAVSEVISINSTFTGNRATEYGGAMYYGTAEDCLFDENTAGIEGNNAYFTSMPYAYFDADYDPDTGRLFVNLSREDDDEPINGIIVTISLYKNNNLVGTYECLSGDSWLAELGSGKYTADLSIEHNSYDAVLNNVTLASDKEETTLTSKDVTSSYNDGSKVVATLKDSNGKAISGAQIKTELNNVAKTLTTDSSGQVSLTTDGLLPDTYTAKFIFEGKDNYGASSTSAKVTVNKLETKLTAKYDANTKNIIATVKDAKGNPVSGLKVGFAINGVKYETTDANGEAKYSTAGLANGTYNVNVQAYGDEICNNSNKEKVTFTIGSKQQAKIYLRNALYFVLQTKMVTVTLWDANKNPIAGKTVYINLDEYGLKYSGVTDENGNAQIRVGVGFGNHPATVSFEGDDQYFGDAKTGRVRVIKETPSLMLPGAYTKFKATEPTKTIKVYLKDRYNKPLLKDTKVFVTINGKQYVGQINAEGIASINIILNKAGVYDVDLYYTGNTAYNAVRKTTKITIV